MHSQGVSLKIEFHCSAMSTESLWMGMGKEMEMARARQSEQEQYEANSQTLPSAVLYLM